MEEQMTTQAMVRWGPGTGTVAIGAAGMIAAAVLAPPGGGVVSIGIYTVVLALVLVVAAHDQDWTRFAWGPLIGFVALTVGYVIGHSELAFAGGVLAVILAIQHSIMERRRKRHTPVAHA